MCWRPALFYTAHCCASGDVYGNESRKLVINGNMEVQRLVTHAIYLQASNAISYDHLLLALLDANPYLSAGSKQALATTAGLAVQNRSRITVLMVDAEEPSGDPAVRLENIQWYVVCHTSAKLAFCMHTLLVHFANTESLSTLPCVNQQSPACHSSAADLRVKLSKQAPLGKALYHGNVLLAQAPARGRSD